MKKIIFFLITIIFVSCAKNEQLNKIRDVIGSTLVNTNMKAVINLKDINGKYLIVELEQDSVNYIGYPPLYRLYFLKIAIELYNSKLIENYDSIAINTRIIGDSYSDQIVINSLGAKEIYHNMLKNERTMRGVNYILETYNDETLDLIDNIIKIHFPRLLPEAKCETSFVGLFIQLTNDLCEVNADPCVCIHILQQYLVYKNQVILFKYLSGTLNEAGISTIDFEETRSKIVDDDVVQAQAAEKWNGDWLGGRVNEPQRKGNVPKSLAE